MYAVGRSVGVLRRFSCWCVLMYPGGVPGVLWASVGLWVRPRRGIGKGRNRAREYAEYSQKIKENDEVVKMIIEKARNFCVFADFKLAEH